MQFAGEHFPDMHKLLLRVEENDTESYDRQLRRFAPRLRFLMRLQIENPKLGEILIELTENEHKLRQYVRRWHDADPQTKRQLKTAARERVRRNLELEDEMMKLRVEKLAGSRDELIDAGFARMTAEGADLASESAELRELVQAFASATDEARGAHASQIRSMIGSGIDDELGAIGKRRERRERMRAEDVDRRVDGIFSHAEKRRSRRP